MAHSGNRSLYLDTLPFESLLHAPLLPRANLRMALSGGGQPWTMSSYLEPDPKGRDVAFLDQYAGERWAGALYPPSPAPRWETVLHYMVASSQQGGISADAVRTLLQVEHQPPTTNHQPPTTNHQPCNLVIIIITNCLSTQAGLMCPDESQDNAPVITRSGFQFLLMERASQVLAR